MSYVLSYYGKPVGCGDYEPLTKHGEHLQAQRTESYGLTWSPGKEGAKLLIVRADEDRKPYNTWGGYLLTEVPCFDDPEASEHV